MGIETELKFRVAPAELAMIARRRIKGAQRGDRTDKALVSTYFDTPKCKLKRRGLTLRVRQSDDQFIQTIKAGAVGPASRGEWESEIDGRKPVLAKADGSPLDAFKPKKLQRKLKPLFKTSVRRRTQMLHTRRSEIEFAIDRGTIAAGRRTLPISEFELELKSGREADLFALARTLERGVGAELDLRGKADKGFELLAGHEGAFLAETITLDPQAPPVHAFQTIAASTLRHFASNADGVRAGAGEAVHQMRVGLRRLRAAISLFGDVLPRRNLARVKSELKWLTGELAPAREIDVFLTERICAIPTNSVPTRGARAIARRFAEQRKACFDRARTAVCSPRYRTLLIDLFEWIVTMKAPASDRAIGPYASALLARRIRKARKQGKALHDMEPLMRHKLRIKIKKIRYGLDFFESLYSKNDRDQLAKRSALLKAIQSALGSLNDFVAHRAIAAEAAMTAPRANRRAQAFASGVMVGQEHAASKTLLDHAAKKLRKLQPLTVEPA